MGLFRKIFFLSPFCLKVYILCRYCEIMVSYVDTPSKFFVQKCGILSKELDSLIKNMTDYYSNRDNSFPSLKVRSMRY